MKRSTEINNQNNGDTGTSGTIPADKGAAAGGEKPVDQQQQQVEKKPSEQSGYLETEQQAAAGFVEKPADEKPKEGESKFKFDREGHDEKTSKLVESFAELNGLSEKQVEGFANFVKSIKVNAESAKTQSAEQAKKAQFANMQKDLATLKANPEFSKDMEQSFMQVNKVLDLMPEVKNMLTEGGRHIDARIAIGLKGLYGKLYGQDGTLVTGAAADQKSNIPIWDQMYDKKV